MQKYGGTSVNSLKLQNKIAENLIKAKEKGYLSVIVVSAMGRKGEPYATDSLLSLISTTHCNTRNMDMLLSCGEIISSVVIASFLSDKGIEAIALTGGQAGILTDSHFGEGNILNVDSTYLKELLSSGKVPVVAGFQGLNEKGEFTTLGRGGSDISAVLLGVALGAKEVDIFTDVDGIMTADPKIVPNAKLINAITYDDVFQLAQYGAKVIHPRAVDLAMKHDMAVKVYNTSKYEETRGTLIHSKREPLQGLIAAIAHEGQKIQLQLKVSGADLELFKEIAFESISIDMINIFNDRSVFITDEIHKERLVHILKKHKVDYDLIENCTKITIIGSKIRGVAGVMSKAIESMESKISILQTSDSHSTISILVPSASANEAVNLLHKGFALGDE